MDTIINFMSDISQPMIGAVMGFLGGIISARLSIRNKQADLIVHFHRQFDELQKKRTEIRVALAKRSDQSKFSEKTPDAEKSPEERALDVEIDMFFQRFWRLQFDEFHAWYEGYIPTSLYAYWAYARWRQFHFNSQSWRLGDKDLRTSVSELPDRWAVDTGQATHVGNFVNLMQTLKSNSAAPNLKQLFQTYGPSRRERLTALIHFGN